MKLFIDRYSYIIMSVLLLLSVIGFSTSSIIYKVYNKKDSRLESLNYLGKIKYLKGTFQKYKESDSVELHTRWLILFDDAIYRSGGNSNFDKYDCISSSWTFWNSLGANIQIEAIPNAIARLNYTSYKITKINKIESGDIIIFKPLWINGRQRWHMGVVEKTFNNKILYMDVNGLLGTREFKYITLYDKKLYAIYKMTFAYWIGELYGKFKL